MIKKKITIITLIAAFMCLLSGCSGCGKSNVDVPEPSVIEKTEVEEVSLEETVEESTVEESIEESTIEETTVEETTTMEEESSVVEVETSTEEPSMIGVEEAEPVSEVAPEPAPEPQPEQAPSSELTDAQIQALRDAIAAESGGLCGEPDTQGNYGVGDGTTDRNLVFH